jgi:hypothetical protein
MADEPQEKQLQYASFLLAFQGLRTNSFFSVVL